MGNATSLKSVVKWWIGENVDRVISMSKMCDEIDDITTTVHSKKYSSESIYRRFREAKQELLEVFGFIPVDKKSAENWFKIVRK